MSVFIYGDVELPFPFHTDFRQDAVYDDFSGTDRILTKFDIKVQTLINSNYLLQLAGDIVGDTTNPADVMNVIRDRLLQPRQKLSIYCNGVNVIPGPQQAAGSAGLQGTVDAANGPQPQSCTITELGNTTFLMSYHIIANYWLNANIGSQSPLVSNSPGNNVLYNRWTETVDIDNCNYTTRTRDGKFLIRSDNAPGYIADQLRTQFAVVGVPPTFLRKSSRYQVDPNGLGIRYQVVDEEQYIMPPKPAFAAEGKYTTKIDFPYAKMITEAHVRLKGDKLTDKAELVKAAIIILSKKLKIATGAAALQSSGTVWSIPLSISLSTEMYENTVEAAAVCWSPPGTTDDQTGKVQSFFGMDYKKLLELPDTNGGGTNYVPNYLTRGTAGILLQAAAYYDPNLQAALNPKQGQMSQGLQPGQAGNTLEQEGNASIPTGVFSQGDNVPVAVEDGVVGPVGVINPNQPIAPNNLIVQVTDVTADGQGGGFQIASDPKMDVWIDFTIINKFESDKHIYMMPISSPQGFTNNAGNQPPASPGTGTIQNNQIGQRAAFVQLASPTLLWICDWTTAKLNSVPDIPDPNNTFDPNWVLLDEHYEPASIIAMANASTPLYRISGTFVYGHISPDPQVIKNIAFGRPPWIPASAFRRDIDPSLVTKNLIDYDAVPVLGGIGAGILAGGGGSFVAGS